MGSTSLHRPAGMTDREFFQDELAGSKRQILACASKRTSGQWSGVFYAAVEESDTGDVWAMVVLMHRGRGDYNFTYKAMTESMGPGENTCPDSILDLLTPTTNEYALAWRAECRSYNAARRAKPKVKAGDKVRFTRPLTFSDGSTADTFVFERGSTFRGADGTGRYRITSWREREYALT